jgi:hypothetical protein
MDTQTVAAIIGLAIAFLVGLFSSRAGKRDEMKVIDLTGKIKLNQDAADKQQADADAKVKEYQDALKEYDPNFHNDDDGGGKPSS